MYVFLRYGRECRPTGARTDASHCGLCGRQVDPGHTQDTGIPRMSSSCYSPAVVILCHCTCTVVPVSVFVEVVSGRGFPLYILVLVATFLKY